jgi:hypothetical protein
VNLPAAAVVGKNCIIHPYCQPQDVRGPVSSGESVRPASEPKEGTP